MSRLGTITRRTFLAVGAVVGGGVAFGYYQYQRDPANPLVADAGETVFNPWVIVGNDGVTVITPRAEMGQGVHTTLAALVAEEMDLSWDQVRTEHGPASAAYYNSAVGEAGTAFLEYEDSWRKTAMQGFLGAVGKLSGLQVTGGSTSIIDAFERMRLAGASARHMLVEAAAARLGVAANTLKTQNGSVITADGTAIAYADLASDAAKLDPPSEPQMKDPKDWVHLGKSKPRVDMVAKSTGTAEFGIDVVLPGMVFASVKVNPVLGAEMTSFDASEAEAMPGVQQIVDLGDGVAVVADNTWIAMTAADTVQINSGPAPYPTETDAIMNKIAEAFENTPKGTLRDDGDALDALTGAKLVEAEYRVPYLAHSTMEPMNATALIEGDTLAIWTGNQAPTLIRDKAAALAGLDADKVTVHTPYMGGGFGRRGEFDAALQAVKLAMAMPGTPVKLTWSREEDTRHDFYRPAAIARLSAVMGNTGPTALDARVAVPSVNDAALTRILGFVPPGPDKLMTEGLFDQPYDIPHHRVAGHAADVDIPIGFWRSVGNSHNGFFSECFMDELAHAGGLDPVEMRLKLMRSEHLPSAKVLEAVAEMSGWGQPMRENHARGVAFTYSFGSPTAEVIEVSQQDYGIKLERIWAAIDVGTAFDPRNIEAQVQSGIIYGLSAAIMGEITFADGAVEQGNFPDYDALRMWQVPPIEVKVLENNTHIGGVGEPSTPPAAPALANAIFALTGERYRSLPLYHEVDFI